MNSERRKMQTCRRKALSGDTGLRAEDEPAKDAEGDKRKGEVQSNVETAGMMLKREQGDCRAWRSGTAKKPALREADDAESTEEHARR